MKYCAMGVGSVAAARPGRWTPWPPQILKQFKEIRRLELIMTSLLILTVLCVMKTDTECVMCYYEILLFVTFHRANLQGVNLLPNTYCKEKNEGSMTILFLALAAPIGLLLTFRRPCRLCSKPLETCTVVRETTFQISPHFQKHSAGPVG